MASLGRLHVSLCVLLIALCLDTCVVGHETTSTLERTDDSLFEGEPYRSTAPDNKWILSTYEHIARAVILVMEDKPPYDVIREEVWSLRGQSNVTSTDIIKKALMYELPFLILGGLSMLCSILIPLIGLIFCCCRYRGRCGGKLKEQNMVQSPVKRRQLMAISIILCCVLMAIGGTGIILSSERLGSSTSAVRGALLDSIDDVITYKNNTIAELEQLAGPNLQSTVNLIEKDLEGVSSFVASPLLAKARKEITLLVHSLVQVEGAMTETRDLLKDVNSTVGSLVILGKALRHHLEEARNNLTDLATECEGNAAAKSQGVCDEIPSASSLNAGADFTKVSNVTEQIENVDDVLKTEIVNEAKKGNKSLEEIQQNVEETTKSHREEISNFTRESKDVLFDMVSQLSDISDQAIKDAVLPAKNKIERSLGTNGVVQEYDQYRFIGNLALASLVLFVVLLTFITLICGILGTNSSDTPSTRSSTANRAGKTFMWCVAFFVILSFFINLPLGVLFVLGSNLTVMCKAAGDLSLLEKTIDDPSLLGYYPVSKAVLGDGDIELKISGVLRGCGNSETPWKLLKMDQKFDLVNITNYKDKIPPMDEIFEKLNSTIASTTVMTDKAKKSLNDTKETGIDDIDFDSFFDQMDKPLVNVSLTEFSTKLNESAAKAMNATFKSFGERMQFIASRLLYVQTDIVEMSETLVGELREKVETLEKKGNETLRDVNAVTHMWEQLQQFLENDAIVIANKDARRFLDRILGHMDQYLETTIRKLRQQVGDCKPLKTVYDVTTSVICDHAVSAVNAFWLSLGVIAVFSVITMILCVHLAKHYRRAQRSSNTPRIGMYGVPLSFFDTSLSRQIHLGLNSPVPEDVNESRWV